MFRFLARSLGLMLLAASFVGFVVDGTRSIANSVVSLSSVAEAGAALAPRLFPALQATVTQKLHPALWDQVLVHALPLPAALAGFMLGGLLLWLGQRPAEPIGYLTSP